LSKSINQATFDKYRAAELKHGRVAQLAVLGYVTQECTRFPGELAYGVKFADIPNGLDAIAAVPPLGWAQIFVAVGAVEINDKSKGGVFALGDFEVGKPILDPEMLAKRQLQELQNGRLAMLAIAELVRHDSSNGGDGLDNLITGFPFLYN
jgi:Chlorophyll A-B binding protein